MALQPVRVRKFSRVPMSTLVNLLKASLTVMVNANIRMAIDMLVSGSKTLFKEKVNFSTPMETVIMVTGMLTRELMVTSNSRMVVSTGPSTRTRKLLDHTRESTLMELSSKDQLSTEKSMDLVLTLSPLEMCGKETLKMTFFKEKVTKL